MGDTLFTQKVIGCDSVAALDSGENILYKK